MRPGIYARKLESNWDSDIAPIEPDGGKSVSQTLCLSDLKVCDQVPCRMWTG